MLVKARNVFSHSGCAHAITVLDLEGITPKFILIVYIYQSRGVKTAVSCAAFRDNTVVLVVGDRKYGRDGPQKIRSLMKNFTQLGAFLHRIRCL